jgi:hypothetical protein
MGTGKVSNDFVNFMNIPLSPKIKVKEVFARNSFATVKISIKNIHLI